jgi:hypothetical protein
MSNATQFEKYLNHIIINLMKQLALTGNPGSMTVIMDFCGIDGALDVLIEWYEKKGSIDPTWKEWISKYETGWLWMLYKQNDKDPVKLCDWFRKELE